MTTISAKTMAILLALGLAAGAGFYLLTRQTSKSTTPQKTSVEESYRDYLARVEALQRDVQEKEATLSGQVCKKWVGDMGTDIDLQGRLNLFFYGPVRDDVKSIKELHHTLTTTHLIQEGDFKKQIYWKNAYLWNNFWKAIVIQTSIQVYQQAGSPLLEEINVLMEERRLKQRPMEDQYGRNEISYGDLCSAVNKLYSRYRAKEIGIHYKHLKTYHSIMMDFFSQEEEIENNVRSLVERAKADGFPENFAQELNGFVAKVRQTTDTMALHPYGFGLLLAPKIVYGWEECHENIPLPEPISYQRANPLVSKKFNEVYGKQLQQRIVTLAQAQWESLSDAERAAFLESIRASVLAKDYLAKATEGFPDATTPSIREALKNFPLAADQMITSTRQANEAAGGNTEVQEMLDAAKVLLPLDEMTDLAIEFSADRVDSKLIDAMRTTTDALEKTTIALDLLDKIIDDTLRPSDLLQLTDFLDGTVPVMDQLPGQMLKNHLKKNVEEGGEIIISGLDTIEKIMDQGYTDANKKSLRQLDARVRTYRGDFAANLFGGREAVETLRKGGQLLKDSADYVKGIWNNLFK